MADRCNPTDSRLGPESPSRSLALDESLRLIFNTLTLSLIFHTVSTFEEAIQLHSHFVRDGLQEAQHNENSGEISSYIQTRARATIHHRAYKAYFKAKGWR